jgi:hypothetical protein
MDEIDDDEVFDLSAAGLTQMSALKMLDQLGVGYRCLSARFTGGLLGPHEIGLKAATTVLGELQELIAEIGAVIRDEVPLRGPLGRSILTGTELRFSPAVAPGSVVFTLLPTMATVLSDGAHESDGSNLLTLSLARLFDVFDDIERPGVSGGESGKFSAAVREFGPRTARHLFNFSQALDHDGLSLEVNWTQSGTPSRRSQLSKSGAVLLSALTKEAMAARVIAE